ncbi:MAG: DUF5723 family protein [Cyclobacteriaceae bacterium]
MYAWVHNGCRERFWKKFTGSLTYTISNHSFNNIGLGMSLNLPPVQIYIVGDNLLRAGIGAMGGNLTSFANSTNYLNVRTGINFVFGWDKSTEKRPSLNLLLKDGLYQF